MDSRNLPVAAPPWLELVATLLVTCFGCGDNLKKAVRPEAVQEDPSVERGCTTDLPARGETRAKYVECEAEMVGGLLAAGRQGDIVLENNLVRFVIRGPGEGFRLHGTSGGGIVDAALHGREDQLLELLPMLDLGAGNLSEIVITSSGRQGAAEEGVAEVVVRGKLTDIPLVSSLLQQNTPDLILEQRYRLYPDRPELEIQTSSFSGSERPSASLISANLRDLLFLGGALDPYLPGRGFLDVSSANTRFLASEGGESSYALVYPDKADSLLNVFEISGLFLLGATEIRSGDPAKTRYFIVGDGSVSSLSDVAYRLVEEVEERVEVSGAGTPGSIIEAQGETGPVSRALVDEEGVFAFRLPSGKNYRLQSLRSGALAGPLVELGLVDESRTGISVEDGASGQLNVSIEDLGGNALPARLMLSSDDFSTVIHLGPQATSISLPPGTYSVSVSRGIEFGIFTQEDLVVADGKSQELQVVLEPEIDTQGWIAVDTHLHSEMSMDSSIPLGERLLSVAGEGIELAISSDHDFVTDYAPYVAKVGLADHLATQSGAEVSSNIIGHINGWPVPPNPSLAAAGAARWYGESPGQIAKLIRDGNSERVVQVNHPRRNNASTFNAIDLNPETLVAVADPESLGMPGADFNDFDFDAIEVANAKSGSSFEEVFSDWLRFVEKGMRKTATGSSDSHSATAFSGRARTYVAVANDKANEVDIDAVNEAIRDGKVTVSQGAFVTLEVDDTVGKARYGIGEVALMEGRTQVELHVRVQAASWLPVTKLEIYQGRQKVFEQQLDAGATQPVRFDENLTLPLTGNGDTFFVARVESAASAEPVLPSPGPSFTNPVYVDRDGDGLYAP